LRYLGSTWSLGLLIRINLLFGGVVPINMAFATRHPA
jgi:hypothetical protein